MPARREPDGVITRVVSILECFSPDEPALGVSDIARRSGLHVATASRLIRQLEDEGLLSRDGQGRVLIGVHLWELAQRAAPTLALRHAAMPVLEELHARVGQHVQLGVLQEGEVLFIERLSAPNAVVNYTRLAGRLPLHASSSGLVLLAYAPPELRERVLGEPLATYTPHTISTARELRSAMAAVRRDGYAFLAGHLHEDALGIAVPVFGERRAVVAALSAIVPNTPSARALIRPLIAGSDRISQQLALSR